MEIVCHIYSLGQCLYIYWNNCTPKNVIFFLFGSFGGQVTIKIMSFRVKYHLDMSSCNSQFSMHDLLLCCVSAGVSKSLYGPAGEAAA